VVQSFTVKYFSLKNLINLLGSKLTLVPIGETVTIHAIYNDEDKRIPYAKPGEGVKVMKYKLL